MIKRAHCLIHASCESAPLPPSSHDEDGATYRSPPLLHPFGVHPHRSPSGAGRRRTAIDGKSRTQLNRLADKPSRRRTAQGAARVVPPRMTLCSLTYRGTRNPYVARRPRRDASRAAANLPCRRRSRTEPDSTSTCRTAARRQTSRPKQVKSQQPVEIKPLRLSQDRLHPLGQQVSTVDLLGESLQVGPGLTPERLRRHAVQLAETLLDFCHVPGLAWLR